MILDLLTNGSRYRSVHPGLSAGLEYLQTGPWRSLPVGKHPIDGDKLFIIIEHPMGKGREGARLEAHRKYIDIQLCTEGREIIGWSPLVACRHIAEPYQESRDILFFGDRPETWLELDGEKFMVLFPDDAHAPLAAVGSLKKAVVKVALDWPAG